MKIQFVDVDMTGHHLAYLTALSGGKGYESVVCLPEKTDLLSCRQIILPRDGVGKGRRFSDYFRWMLRIREIYRREKPDIIHFVYGDSLYKFFGVGFGLFGKTKKIVTIHSFRQSKVAGLSLRCIAGKCEIVVVHSDFIKQQIINLGVRNVVNVNYPCFKRIDSSKNEAIKYYGLKEGIPIIAALGNICERKGPDILLNAMGRVSAPFQLLIAGKAEDYDEAYIREKGSAFLDKLFLKTEYLTEEEFSLALAASDLVVLPYRKSFNGASGPLCEGVYGNKCIVASDHGNLGDTVTANHLGYVFEAENAVALAEVLEKALREQFVPDETYMKYKASLQPNEFVKSYEMIYRSMMKES